MHARSPVCVVRRLCTHTCVVTFTFAYARVRRLPLTLLMATNSEILETPDLEPIVSDLIIIKLPDWISLFKTA